jgi:Fic family protein
MAIAHYQFEAIHPFEDGNGRTGRVMNMLLLVEAQILNLPILFLSRYIIENRDVYYALLLAVTAEQKWEEWVLFVLEGLRQTAESTLRKIDAVVDLQGEAAAAVRGITPGGANADLLAVLFEQPYVRIKNVVERCHVSRPTATHWLNALVDAGVLHDQRVGRDRLFINTRFLKVLTRDEDVPVRRSEPTLF